MRVDSTEQPDEIPTAVEQQMISESFSSTSNARKKDPEADRKEVQFEEGEEDDVKEGD